MISEATGGRITLTANAIVASGASPTARLLCAASVNGVDSYSIAYHASASISAAPSAFSFVNQLNVIDLRAWAAGNAASLLLTATDAGACLRRANPYLRKQIANI